MKIFDVFVFSISHWLPNGEIFEKYVTDETALLYCLASLNQLRCYHNALLLWKQN